MNDYKPSIGKLSSQITVGVLINPREWLHRAAFERLVWVPLVALLVTASLAQMLNLPQMRAEIAKQIEQDSLQSEQGVADRSITDEQRELLERLPVVVFISTPVAMVSNLILIALAIYIIGKLGFKSGIPFKIVFNFTTWSSLPLSISFIMTFLLKSANPEWELPSNLAWFMNKMTADQFLFNLFKALDIFVIWQVGLLSIGFATVYGIPILLTVRILGTMFLIIAVIHAGLSTMPMK